ncbi:MAG: ABC transporter substrate-binding protein, partial [Gammaproteobacteria bacterium]|nr:ABC transporter substrate-binding protein [Gammaproteobacteria bacterium]
MIRNLRDRTSFRACAIGLLLGAAGMSLTGAAAEPAAARTDEPTALKIGLLLDLSSGSTEVHRDRQRAFELAIRHVNEGGGVFGLPVTVAVGDATAEPEKAVAAARHLVEVEGVHAIVGPNASASALPVAERVIGPAAIPTVSFSATSPALT